MAGWANYLWAIVKANQRIRKKEIYRRKRKRENKNQWKESKLVNVYKTIAKNTIKV